MRDDAEQTYILAAELDADSLAWLDDLRKRHFPVERNVLSAHLTMFHRLSPQQVQRLLGAIMPVRPIAVAFDRVIFLGFGNAIGATSVALQDLRQGLKSMVSGGLSRQDEQKWHPHVTVQNKVPADTARELFRQLDSTFVARSGHITGLLVFEYLGGPWRAAHRLPFGTSEKDGIAGSGFPAGHAFAARR